MRAGPAARFNMRKRETAPALDVTLCCTSAKHKLDVTRDAPSYQKPRDARRWRVLTAAAAASCRVAAVAALGTPGLLPAAQGGEMLAVSPATAEP